MIYFIQDSQTKFIKIGTANNVLDRLKSIQGGSTFIVDLLAVKPGNRKEERTLHLKFEKSRINGEWFKPSKDLISFIGRIEDEYYDESEGIRIKLEETKSRGLAGRISQFRRNVKFDLRRKIKELAGIEVLLTPQDLAVIFQISEKKVSNWIGSGKDLPQHIKFHGCIRFRRSDVIKWIEEKEGVHAEKSTSEDR